MSYYYFNYRIVALVTSLLFEYHVSEVNYLFSIVRVIHIVICQIRQFEIQNYNRYRYCNLLSYRTTKQLRAVYDSCIMAAIQWMCDKILADDHLLARIQQQKFDLMILDVFYATKCYYIIPYKLDVPFIGRVRL